MKNYEEPIGIKKDCVSYKNGCIALNDTWCAKENCKFYKNRKMLNEQINRIRERIPDYGMDRRDKLYY